MIPMRCVLLALVFAFSANTASATRWSDKAKPCPLCETEGTYKVIASYGSYIYRWPSKFQYLFWPLTDTYSVYTCLSCRFTCYLWDFDDVPEEKQEAILDALKGVTLEGEFEEYCDIPMSRRLEIAKAVYEVLERDDDFWCQYHRLVAYHLCRESSLEEDAKVKKQLTDRAGAERREALQLADRMLKDQENEGQKKEILLIAGAMHHYLGEDEKALARFEEAGKLTFASEKIPQEDREGEDRYLSSLLEEYTRRIEEGDRPADAKRQ